MSDDTIYKTVRIASVSLLERDGEWNILGFPDMRISSDYPYVLAILPTIEEAKEKLDAFTRRTRSPDGTLRTFPRGVRQHLYEYLLP